MRTTIAASLVRLICLAALALAFAPAARAEAPPPASGDLLLEVDPTTFALGGLSGHVRFRPASGSWSFGAGAYAMDLPSPLVDLDPSNRDKGWKVRIRAGAALFVDRFFANAPDGPFAGVEAGWQRIRLIDARVAPGSVEYDALLLMGRGGWLWRPFASGFYVMPWVGAGWASKVSGRSTLGGVSYDVSPLAVFATVHLGWRL